MAIDDKTRTELEAAVFRRLVEHLRARTDVQNIDLMNLAGFCRNCLSNWLKEEADARGADLSKDESREAVYGMPYETWKQTYQGAASAEQLEAMKKAQSGALTLFSSLLCLTSPERRPHIPPHPGECASRASRRMAACGVPSFETPCCAWLLIV